MRMPEHGDGATPHMARRVRWRNSHLCRLLPGLWLACCVLPAAAHTSSLAYLDVEPAGENRIALQWAISLVDLNEAVPLDGNGDGSITWGELRRRKPALAALTAARVRVQQHGRDCPQAASFGLRADERQGEPYAIVDAVVQCPQAVATLQLDYGFMAGRNDEHRALVTVHAADGGALTRVMAPGAPALGLSLEQGQGAMHSLAGFVGHGFRHILEGWDHVLFVLLLVVSVMLPRTATGAHALRPRLWRLLKLATVFTLAHSLTLALAAFGVVALPARLVEAGIAASIVITAVHNLWPLARRRWEGVLVFAFGLLHGMGFATLLGELLLSSQHRLAALAGFNIGVEFGQLLVMLLALPPLLLLRQRPSARALAPAMSLAAVAVGSVWFVQRVAS